MRDLSQLDWVHLVYLAGWLVLLLPALFMYRNRRTRFWRDAALWLALAGIAALAYVTVGPG